MEETGKQRQANYNYKTSIEKDFNNPACKPYTTLPMSQLSEPKFSSEGGSCWHIYTHRYYDSDIKLPLTKESYEDGQSLHYWKMFFVNLGIFSLLVVLSFGLIALIYKIGRWIIAGFSKPPKDTP